MKPDAAKGQHDTVANRRLLCEAFTCLNLINLQDRHKNYDPARKLYMITVCVCVHVHACVFVAYFAAAVKEACSLFSLPFPRSPLLTLPCQILGVKQLRCDRRWLLLSKVMEVFQSSVRHMGGRNGTRNRSSHQKSHLWFKVLTFPRRADFFFTLVQFWSLVTADDSVSVASWSRIRSNALKLL